MRLLGLLTQSGVGGGGLGTAFAEAYGPTAERPADVEPGFQYFDTDEKQLIIVWDGQGWAEFSPGPHTVVAVPAHDTVTLTTPSLAPGANYEVTLSLGETYLLRSLSLSPEGRVQAYLSVAARTADAARAFGEAFTDALKPYIFFDAQLPHEGSSSLPANLPGSGLLYLQVTNTGAAAQVITADFERLVLEPEEVN